MSDLLVERAIGCPACGGDAIIEIRLLPAEPSVGLGAGHNVEGYTCETGCHLTEERLRGIADDEVPDIIEEMYERPDRE